MRLYTVHVPAIARSSSPGSADADLIGELVSGTVPVKEGFCWPALFFSILWALWHRLWWVALGLIIINALAGGLLAFFGADQVVQTAVSAGIAVALGFLANDLRRRKLTRGGLSERSVVAAATGETAVARYFAGRTNGGRG